MNDIKSQRGTNPDAGGPAVESERGGGGNGAYDISQFVLKETLGTGTFGRVRLASRPNEIDGTTEHRALKILKKSKLIELKQIDHAKAEVEILSKARSHPFVVNLVGRFQNETILVLVLEYVQGGELYSRMRTEEPLSNSDATFYASEIVCAFGHLHGMDCVYRDLKPENVLLTTEGHIKITDFGFAKLLEKDGLAWTLCGTPEYLAPEIIQCQGHGKSVDWWTLGILIYEMLCGDTPYRDEHPFGIYQKILTGSVYFPPDMENKAKNIIKKLLKHDRTKRLGCDRNGASSVKRHGWFAKVDWDAVLSRAVEAPFRPEVKGVDDTSHFDDYPDSDEEDDDEEGVATSALSDEQQRMFDFF